MDTHFEVVYVPLPPEREAEWWQAIHVIAELLYAELVKSPGSGLDQAISPHGVQVSGEDLHPGEIISPVSVANIHGGERMKK